MRLAGQRHDVKRQENKHHVDKRRGVISGTTSPSAASLPTSIAMTQRPSQK
jgi:hypothetical protein